MNHRQKLLAMAVTSSLAAFKVAEAATITVDSGADDSDPSICTLRSAINAANSNMVIGGCNAGDVAEPDVINIDPSLAGATVALTTGQLDITSSVTINGPSVGQAAFAISAGNVHRVMRISDGYFDNAIDVTLNGLALTNGLATGNGDDGGALINFDENVQLTTCLLSGNAAPSEGGAISNTGVMTISDCIISGNTASSEGGAIANGGQMTITHSTISSNSAQRGGGLQTLASASVMNLDNVVLSDNQARSGGAIYALQSVAIDDSQLLNNTATGSGGAVLLRTGGSLQISNSYVSSNNAASSGGAIYSYFGSISIVESSFSGNTARFGGAVRAELADLTAVQSTFNGNIAEQGAALLGAAYYSLTLAETTVSRNTATGATASAAVLSYGPMIITNSTLVANLPTAIAKNDLLDLQPWRMINSVLSGSSGVDCVDPSGTLEQNENNLIGDGSCAAGAANLLTGDPMLGPLADNGGPTLTHAVLSGSPLVDAGNNAACGDVDQTGMPRPIDGNSDSNPACDIGSVEFVDQFPPIANLTNAPDVTDPGGNTIAIEVTYADLDGVVDFASVNPGDIRIDPGPLAVQSVALSGTPSQLVATYTAIPPGGDWDANDSGDYTVSVNPGEVLDTASTGPNAIIATVLGGFSVAIGELDLLGMNTSIADGDATPSVSDATDFGDVAMGASNSQTFTLTNIGGGTINITAPLEIFGQGFGVSQPTDVRLAAGESTQFEVSFTPTAVGPVTGQVTILNDDADENPYTFAVGGNGVMAEEVVFTDGFERR